MTNNKGFSTALKIQKYVNKDSTLSVTAIMMNTHKDEVVGLLGANLLSQIFLLEKSPKQVLA
jgi:hypothetical protein